jgi:dTMP kinase
VVDAAASASDIAAAVLAIVEPLLSAGGDGPETEAAQ